MRIKCPHCNGKGFSELNSAVNMTCGWCMGQGELDLEIVPTKPQTEQEWIQTATTEQLVDFLITSIKKCKSCANGIGIDEVQHCPFGECGCHFKDEVIKWLKQPHREVTG